MKKTQLRQIIKNILKEGNINEQALSDFVLTCTGGACLCECTNIDASTTCPAPCSTNCSDFCIEPGVAPVTPNKSFPNNQGGSGVKPEFQKRNKMMRRKLKEQTPSGTAGPRPFGPDKGNQKVPMKGKPGMGKKLGTGGGKYKDPVRHHGIDGGGPGPLIPGCVVSVSGWNDGSNPYVGLYEPTFNPNATADCVGDPLPQNIINAFANGNYELTGISVFGASSTVDTSCCVFYIGIDD